MRDKIHMRIAGRTLRHSIIVDVEVLITQDVNSEGGNNSSGTVEHTKIFRATVGHLDPSQAGIRITTLSNSHIHTVDLLYPDVVRLST